jgi:hypothetical protein
MEHGIMNGGEKVATTRTGDPAAVDVCSEWPPRPEHGHNYIESPA